MAHTEDSEFTHHESCPNCNSSDALARYTDGHGFCFSCQHYEPGDGDDRRGDHVRSDDGTARSMRMSHLVEGAWSELPRRRLSVATCTKFGYSTGTYRDQPVHIADYRDDTNSVVAQHIRFPDKDFSWVGDAKHVQLFGQHLWGPGKMVVVTEGEIDCMSVSQQQGNKWPVVSVPGGAAGAAKAIKRNLKFFDQFETTVLMFDMDDAGRAGVAECAPLFPVGRCKVAQLPLKDASDMLQAGRGPEIINAIWQAKPWRPEGSVKLSDIRDAMKAEIQQGLPWCLPKLTELTYGRRYGEIYTLGAGTGVGKTDFLTQQVEYDLNTLHEKVSVIFLEQQPQETGKRIAGKSIGKLLHIPNDDETILWTNEERDAAVDALCDGNLLDLYDHFGCAEWPRIEAHIRFLNKAEGYRIFYLDHLTALADTGDNERGSLEEIMGGMGALVKELDIMLILVSHLTTPDGKPHEEGGRVTVRQFKGSRAIGFWSHFMFGLERDQQAEDLEDRKLTTFRILKDRYTGRATGQTFDLTYEQDTGRLREANLFDTDEAAPF